MKLAYFNGGLGNQMFQYIFTRYAEIMKQQQIILDDAFFFLTEEKRLLEKSAAVATVHNGYEIERVFPKAKKPALLSQQFPAEDWSLMLSKAKDGRSIPQQFLDNGIELGMIAETDNFTFSGLVKMIPVGQYHPEILNVKGNIYYHGYWLSRKWFEAIKSAVLPELEFPPLEKEQNKQYAHEIRTTKSAAIHIRRGDFVSLQWAIPPDYYYNIIQQLSRQDPDLTYFIFSDDIAWCKENAEKLGFGLTGGKLVFVEGNCDKENNYVDMQLMSMCKLIVVGISSFSYLASLLSTTPGLISINLRFQS